MSKNKLITSLALKPHPEGGYFRRTFSSRYSCTAAGAPDEAVDGSVRPAMSSIYYLLTDESPIGYWHRNRSDIMHYFHCGSALRYWLISPQGELSCQLLGPDLDADHQLQLRVPGGYWKATELSAGEYGLLSEAVCPGFVADDMELASAERLAAAYPQHAAIARRLAYREPAPKFVDPF